MEIDEAIDFAVSQLKAQGVDLKHIILDKEVVSGIDDLAEFDRMFGNEQDVDPQNIETCLAMMGRACTLASKNVQYRMYAANLGVFSTIVRLIESFRNESSIVHRILLNMDKIVSGFPDLIVESTMSLLLELNDQHHDENITTALGNVLISSLEKHEGNKKAFFDNVVARRVLDEMLNSKKDDHVRAAADLITNLCLDDDIRVQVPGAHVRATSLADLYLETTYLYLRTQEEVCQACHAMVHKSMITSLLKAVASMAVTNLLVARIHDVDTDFSILVTLLKNYKKQEDIIANANKLMAAISGNDACKASMTPLIPLIVKGVDENLASPKVIQSSFLVIATLTLRSHANSMAFIELHAIEKIAQAMKVLNQTKVRRYGCLALRNIASSSHVKEPFEECDIEELMNTFMQIDSLKEDSKSVLVALGAPVALTERWTGEKGDVVAKNERLGQ
ncbi:hypothetical protein GE061_001168 [Apolygus lucorum]|uniref:Armadillo repeat-containing domain-containing protein n=1 Tax=Apolygus lucorum TaxID=248454 RepID=A0A6A4K4L7_APOLU|nr:hypothetical protein GE061_001168 [Apolygus lucorum]